MARRPPDKVRRAVDRALNVDGATSTELRAAVEARGARLAGASRPERPESDIPEPLREYVDKVARHAYEVTDRDVEALTEAGYSEEEIFEITVCVALGAGLARMERGLDVLRRSR